jgi:ABC-type multidrug transport system fused ATPase/permease subunit
VACQHQAPTPIPGTPQIAEFQEVLDEIEAEHPHPSVAGPVGDRLCTKLPPINAQRQCESKDFYLHEAWPECAGAHVHGDGDDDDDDGLGGGAAKPQRIELSGVDLVTPRGLAIATDVDCEVTPSSPLMISGRNATGKTSFVRVLAGLWPHSRGELTAP